MLEAAIHMGRSCISIECDGIYTNMFFACEIFNTYPMVISNKWEIVTLNDIDPSAKVEDNKINLLVIVHPGLC